MRVNAADASPFAGQKRGHSQSAKRLPATGESDPLLQSAARSFRIHLGPTEIIDEFQLADAGAGNL